jgi:hypothetical protein
LAAEILYTVDSVYFDEWGGLNMSETKEVSIEQAEYEILQSLLDTADLSIKETSASTQEMDTLQRVLRTLKEEVDKKRPYLPTDHPHYKPRELTMYEKKYEHTLSGDTIHELIDEFNHQRGIRVPSNNRWGYLREIDRAIMSSGFDCTAVEGPEKRLDRSHRIKLEGQCIVQIIED